MRKLIIILIAFSLIFTIACGSDSGSTDSTSTTPSTPFVGKKWTIMIYMAADNDLAPYAQPDIDEMKAANPALFNDVNVIVLKDLRTTGDSQLLEITSNTETKLSCASLGIDKDELYSEVDMASNYTVDKFIEFCKINYPSQYTALIIWNHGDGWRNKFNTVNKPRISFSEMRKKIKVFKSSIISTSRSISTVNSFVSNLIKRQKVTASLNNYKAVCLDESSGGSVLSINLLHNGIRGAGDVTIIGFDACYMGMIEVAYELRDRADYMIASEEKIPGNGWNYTTFFNNLAVYTDKTKLNFCQSAVNAYATEYSGTPEATLAAYDLSKVPGVITALNNFSSTLASSITSYTIAEEIFNIFYVNTEDYFSVPGDNNMDLWHAADNILNSTDYCDTQAAALKTAIENLVVYEWHNSSGNPNSHGVAIYLLTHFIDPDTGDVIIGHDNRYSDSYSGSDKIAFLTATTYGLGTSELLYKIFYQSY